MFRDIQAVCDLIYRILNVENAFLVKIQHNLAILGVIRHAAIGINFFNAVLQCLRNQIVNGRGKVNVRMDIPFVVE